MNAMHEHELIPRKKERKLKETDFISIQKPAIYLPGAFALVRIRFLKRRAFFSLRKLNRERRFEMTLQSECSCDRHICPAKPACLIPITQRKVADN